MKVQIENLIKSYNGNTVLNIDRFNIEEGKIYAVLGLNGSGKSTLMECIAGLIPYDSGSVAYNGLKDINPVRKHVAICTQKQYLFNKTVKDNIAWGLQIRREDRAIIEKKLDEYLGYFRMDRMLHKNARRLSGGEAAKTALLRTAVLEAELTILDEPTASMDIESTLQAEQLIKSMVGGKRSVVIVTHDMYQAQRLADEVIFMDKGIIIEKGNVKKIFLRPQSNYLKKILNL